MIRIEKYPRTPHIAGSRLQLGDEGCRAAGFDAIAARHLVVEEKVDGANAAISFDASGNLLLQSRGHYLTGGPRERHFDLLKSWANAIRDRLWPVLHDRFIIYGEWLYAKHTIFYDNLPHYFLEFDVLDRARDVFLSTAARRDLLRDLPICSVQIVYQGVIESPSALRSLVGPTPYKSPAWQEKLTEAASSPPHDPALVVRQTDQSDLMEGLYIKAEDADRVLSRFKYVRQSFIATVFDSESHWQSRPILPNTLAPGVSMMAID